MYGLIDGDILRYELGYAAETGWRASNPGELPPFEYVEKLLLERLERIKLETKVEEYTIFLSKGKSFRFDLAKDRPYKGTRRHKKPHHFDNLTIYIRDVLNGVEVEGIEADDAMAMYQTESGYTSCIISRDKDLRQVPGWSYSWELANQPSYGPICVTEEGELELIDDKIVGNGWAFFCAQLLIGDVVDNIPGLPRCGPIGAYKILYPFVDNPEEMFNEVVNAYKDYYDLDEWEEKLLEQGQLLWMVRRRNEDGSPQLWNMELRR